MATWDLRRLQKSLYDSNPGPLYLIIGEEAFLIREALVSLKAAVLKEGAVDFNFDSFFSTDVKPSQVQDAVETLPMMCPRRLVIYRDVHLLKEKEWDPLLALVQKPVETTTLVLVGDKLDKRKKLYKQIAKQAPIVELKAPYENQVPMWIEYIAQKQGLTLTPEASALIKQFIGVNLSEISSELSKLKSFVDHRDRVDAQDVLKVVSRTRLQSVFDLANAIGQNDRETALICLANLLDQGQNEIGVLALISRHIRILALLKEGLKVGVKGSKLCAKAGIPAFFLNEYLAQTRLWSERKIAQTIQALRDTDKALKSSPVSSHIWLENFVIRTCS